MQRAIVVRKQCKCQSVVSGSGDMYAMRCCWRMQPRSLWLVWIGARTVQMVATLQHVHAHSSSSSYMYLAQIKKRTLRGSGRFRHLLADENGRLHSGTGKEHAAYINR
mmetsp:Transcript_6336/g.12620  ORF Transcript_6336/g.12620 Transcript_6336/m.12620 type:complete len:108 (+) Transcript_6336:119-442(+)